jgi:hypothetical protein
MPLKSRKPLVDHLRPEFEKVFPGAKEDFFLLLKDEEGAVKLQETMKRFNELKAVNPEKALDFAAGARPNMSKLQASHLDILTNDLKEATKFEQKKSLESFKQEAIGQREFVKESIKLRADQLVRKENQEFQKELLTIKDKTKKVEKLSDRTRQIEDKFQSPNNKILSFANLLSSKKVADFTPADDFSLMFQFISMLDDSVVRGNEIGTFNQGFGVFDRLKGTIRRVMGGGRFDDNVRKQIITTMKQNVSGILQNQKNSLVSVQRGAKQAGSEINDVITDPLQRKLLETSDLKSLFKVKGPVADTPDAGAVGALLDKLEDPKFRESAGLGGLTAAEQAQAPAPKPRKRLPSQLLREEGVE